MHVLDPHIPMHVLDPHIPMHLLDPHIPMHLLDPHIPMHLLVLVEIITPLGLVHIAGTITITNTNTNDLANFWQKSLRYIVDL